MDRCSESDPEWESPDQKSVFLRGLSTSIFVRGQIFVIRVIQFGGNLFRNSLLFSFRWANYKLSRHCNRELRPFIIVLVEIIVEENITERHHPCSPRNHLLYTVFEDVLFYQSRVSGFCTRQSRYPEIT
jgi:hypothetical protein